MAIFYNGKEIISGRINKTDLFQVVYNKQVIWEKIESAIEEINKVLSCYFNGYWIDEYPWSDNTVWTD